MTEITSYSYKNVYASLGIDTNKLGVLMLDVEPFEVTEHVEKGEADLYETQSQKFWINGAVAEQSAHLTLLYGFLAPAREWAGLIDSVLDTWVPPQLEIEKVGIFPSRDPDEDYTVIVGHIKVTDRLLEGHQRLQLLPHIDTFPEYKPHITLAYIKDGPSNVDWAKTASEKWVRSLQKELTGKKFSVTGFNYGKDD